MMLRLLSQRCLIPKFQLGRALVLQQPFSTTPSAFKKALPPRPKPPPDSEIEEFYLKGSGPGGQKINKTNSAVQLRHIPTGVVVKSQATRSREQNRKHAREILAQKIDEVQNGEQSRSAIVGRIKHKKAVSAEKKKRRKYRKLDDEKRAAEESDPEQTDQDHDHSIEQEVAGEGGTKGCEQSGLETPDAKP